MKRGRVFPLLVCFVLCVISPRSANAVPQLDLWMTHDFSGTSPFEIQVHRTNTDFGLGSLTYNLQFSESLNLTREYSDHGWVADTVSIDDVYDNSSPIDGSSGSFTNIYFDTVHSPAGEEFGVGSGVVEALTIEIIDWTPRWIYLDVVSPAATNGSGVDLITGLGGSLTVSPGSNPYALEQGHTLAIYIPEPITMVLFGLEDY